MGFSSVNPSKFFFFFLIFSWSLFLCYSNEDQQRDDHSLYSFTYVDRLNHYDWRYIKVQLPPWFTSATIAVDSNVKLDLKMMNSSRKSELPMVCAREGGPPLPDVSENALNALVLVNLFNGSLHDEGDCYALQKNMKLTFTNEQILPGVLYVGFFNGIGPIRTQSKMINRGSSYSFTANVTVEGCTNESMGGQDCNQRIHRLSCAESDINELEQAHQDFDVYNMAMSTITCKNQLDDSCQLDFESKIYSLDVEAEQFVISANHIKFHGNHLLGYARYGAIPRENLYDFSFDLSKGPIVIQSPKIGKWYLLVEPVGLSNVLEGTQEMDVSVCYSLKWRVFACPRGKAGPNCTWEMHSLEDHKTENSNVPVIYLPYHANLSLESLNFPLEPLLSKTSARDATNRAWTYFLLNVLQDSSGNNLHIQLSSDQKIDYELYARYRGLPSLSNYDYYYSNKTSNSNIDSMFKFYGSSNEKMDLYLLYPREGLWILGLRDTVYRNSSSPKTNMSVSIKSCPNECSGHGTCSPYRKEPTRYCACECDRTHGGFDCSVELVSRADQTWHAISLIASNTAAMFPAFCALRQKAFAEWVIFMCSGFASGLYHACDVGTWCALSFRTLQFMDFWLSFMAVVSTFVFLAVINESAKRTIHTIAWIVTALMALTGPTKSRNIVLVLVIGAMCLVVGWLIEFLSTYKSNSQSLRSYIDILESRWQNVKEGSFNLVKTIYHRLRWWFVLAGFVALAMAAISWTLETSQTYWIWHSTWHVSIYMSSFFFLCSKAATNNGENYLAVEDQASSVPSPTV